jgi:hypothetical protein
LVTRDDVISFRNQIYRTIEKRDQEIFLCNFVNICNPKQFTSSKAHRLLTAYYYVPTESGQKLQVCSNMFQAVTLKPETSTRRIRDRLLKKELLTNGNLPGETRVNRKRSNKSMLEEAIDARKEKVLSLKKGSISSVKSVFNEPEVVINEIGMELPGFEDYHQMLKKSKMSHAGPELLVQKARGQLNLDEFECCRICLENKKDLVPIFKKAGKKKLKPVDLIQYCLPLKPEKHDGMPQNICSDCFEKVKVAYQLKINSLESLNVMRKMMKEKQTFQIPGNSEVLADYTERRDEHPELEENLGILKLKQEMPDPDEEYQEFDETQYSMEKEEPELDLEPEQSEISQEQPGIPQEQQKDSKKPENSRKVFSDASMVPRKCYLCNEKFKTTPEEHFSMVHQLIESSRCCKCCFESEFPWFMNLHYQVHEDDYKIW